MIIDQVKSNCINMSCDLYIPRQNKGLRRNTNDNYDTKFILAEEYVEIAHQYIDISKDDLAIVARQWLIHSTYPS